MEKLFKTMNWELARLLAKVLNVLFLVFISCIIFNIYQNELVVNSINKKTENFNPKSVFYYDNDEFVYFKLEKRNDFLLNHVLNKQLIENATIEENDIVTEIINHRISIVYLFSIFFGDLVKLINRIGVI